MHIPLDPKVKELADLPYTISFIIRKRQQIDSLNELPKDKKPTEDIIWNGTTEEMEGWLEKVFDHKNKNKDELVLNIKDTDIEG